MRRIYLIFLILSSLSANAITRENLTDYAKSLQGKKKSELKTAIHQLIGSPTTLSYGSGNANTTWGGFYSTDRNSETNECINRYSARKFYFGSKGSSISGMNIEHSFPKSWWGGTENKAYKDLYNLYPSDESANSSKSNYPMGIVTKVKSEEEGYDKVGTGTIDGVSGRNCWEPGDQYKGDFARAYMYMATSYQDLTWKGTEGLQQLENDTWPTLKQWAYTLYLTWLISDPVDDLEIDRNNAVSKIQGNRNLFVDFPYLAEYVWGDSTDVVFNPYTSVTTAEDDARYTGHATIVDDDDDPSLPTDIVETFDQCKGQGGNDGKFSGSVASATFTPDNDGWVADSKYGGDKCARFGNSSSAGVVTTPEFSVNGTSTFSFRAAAWVGDGTSLKLSVCSGNATLSQSSVTMKAGEWTTYTLTLTGSGNVKIKFTPSKRFFLDDVYVHAQKVPGDVNKDGQLTIDDVMALADIILGIIPSDSTDYDMEAADYNNDGQTSIADVTKLLNTILKQ